MNTRPFYLFLVHVSFIWLCLESHAQSPYFVSPVEGRYGEDFFIVHYVDWEWEGIGDYQCGKKTYDGHQGTDFILKDFAQMDAGVAVRAVRAGRVIAVLDTLFDRNKRINNGQLGNFIAIAHDQRLFTYYAHLKQHSAGVSLGDWVVAGQYLGQVGSSGNSTDPHLHFELWYDSTTLIDPFGGGPCGNAFDYFDGQFGYDSSFRVYQTGLLNFMPTLDTLRESPPTQRIFVEGQDSLIAFWVHLQGIRLGDTLRLAVYTEDQQMPFFSQVHPIDSPHWYFRWWASVPLPSVSGRFVFSRNGVVEATQSFEIQSQTITGLPPDISPNLYRCAQGLCLEDLPATPEALDCFTLTGQHLCQARLQKTGQDRYTANLPPLPPSLYLIRIQTSRGVIQQKIYWE
ncbi:MAG: M23 family metallopeptidase [Bernardetiaceae bacterium]